MSADLTQMLTLAPQPKDVYREVEREFLCGLDDARKLSGRAADKGKRIFQLTINDRNDGKNNLDKWNACSRDHLLAVAKMIGQRLARAGQPDSKDDIEPAELQAAAVAEMKDSIGRRCRSPALVDALVKGCGGSQEADRTRVDAILAILMPDICASFVNAVVGGSEHPNNTAVPRRDELA